MAGLLPVGTRKGSSCSVIKRGRLAGRRRSSQAGSSTTPISSIARDGTLDAATSEEAQDGIRSVIDLAEFPLPGSAPAVVAVPAPGSGVGWWAGSSTPPSTTTALM